MPTTEEFVSSIKEKYPVYKDIPTQDLVTKIVDKYPQYKEQISDYGKNSNIQDSNSNSPEIIKPTRNKIKPEPIRPDTLTTDKRNIFQKAIQGAQVRADVPEPVSGMTPKETGQALLQSGVKGVTAIAPLAIPVGPEVSVGLKVGEMAGPVAGWLAKTAVGSGIISGVTAISSAIEGLTEGKSIKQIKKEAIKTGETVGALDVGIRVLTGPAYSAVKTGVEKVAKPIVESKIAQETLKGITSNTKKALNFLSDRASVLKRDIDLKVSDLTKNHINKISSEIDSATDALGALNKDIDTHAYNMVKPMSEAIPAVKIALNGEYETLLNPKVKGSMANTPVDLSSDLDNILALSGLPPLRTTSPKDKLILVAQTLLKKLPPSEKEAGELTNLIKRNAGKDDSITLRDAHWLKQSLYKHSSQLMKSAPEQEIGIAVKNIAESVADNIDKQVAGSKYADLSSRYRSYIKISDYVDSAIGKLREVGGKEKIRENVTTRLLNQTKQVLEKGGELTDEVYQSQAKAVDAFYKQSDLLRQNGQSKLANELDSRLNEIATKVSQSKQVKDSITNLKSIMKDDPELVKQLQTGYKEHIYSLQEAKKRIGRMLSSQKEELESKIVKHTEQSLIAFSIAVSAIGVLTASTVGLIDPKIKTATQIISGSIIALYGMKKYGSRFAEVVDRGISKIEDYVNKTPLPDAVRKAYLFSINKTRSEQPINEEDSGQ